MKYLWLLFVCAAALAAAQQITQLQVPLYADPRRAAELECRFDMRDQRLHSVKWYRDVDEIFRYNPSQQIPIRLFNVTGVSVLHGACAPARCEVRVMPAPVAARAAYTCEVSTEGPKFLIARQTKHMTVVALPVSDPVISGGERGAPGEPLLLNCSADYSLPPAEISWFVDDELQKPEPWQRTELSAAAAGGLRAAWRVVRVRAPRAPGSALRVRCEAVLPVEPPVRRDAARLIAPYSATQLSKYVANGGSRNIQYLHWSVMLWTVKELVRFLCL